MTLRRSWLLIGWIAIAIVVIGSLTPNANEEVPGGDKFHHLLAYGVLYWWFAQETVKSTRPGTFVGLILMGIIIEFLQPFTGRTFDFSDMIANTSGILIGWTLVKFGVNLPHQLRKNLPAERSA